MIDEPLPKLTGPDLLASIIDKFMANSKCATENEQKIYLLSLFGNKRLVTTLLFRGSEHGWKLKNFHSRCDYKGPTICLFKIKDGDCIGGYTKAQWSSPYTDNHVSESEAMLFNLSCCRHFPSKNTGKDIYCSYKVGPCFDGGSSELSAWDEPINGDGKCSSWANKPGYRIPIDNEGTNLLTNKMNGVFTISEMEVWEITGFME